MPGTLVGEWGCRLSSSLLLILLITAIIAVLLSLAAYWARRRAIEARLPSRLESIRSVSDMVIKYARRARLDEQEAYQCKLAVDEACSNIIRHAYGGDPTGEFAVAIRIDSGVCEIQFTDYGEPYDPQDIPPPAIGNTIEDARPGGLGLYLIRSVMDEVRYTPGPQGNRLVMVKRRSPERRPSP
jgi:anti-sigma regulatory factor (Ser/Thr protein kinase)